MKALIVITALLLPVIGHSQIDSVKIQTYVETIRKTLLFPDSARAIAEEFLEYSRENQYSWGIAQAYLQIGATYHRQSEYDSANLFFDRCIAINQMKGDSTQLATANLNKGMISINTGDFQDAMRRILFALRIYEANDQTKESKESIPRCFNNLGQVYYYQGDFEKALEYFELFNQSAIRLKDTLQIASSLTNLGAAYYELGQFEKTMECDKKALALHTGINNLLGMANAINNIASGYEEKLDFDQAINYYNQAVEVYLKVPNRRGVAEAYYNKGKLYLRQLNYSSGKENLKSALELSAEVNDKYLRKKIVKSLSELFEQQGDFKKALSYYQEFHVLSDSLVNEKNVSKVNELEIEYETEKKEQQIELLNKENQLQTAEIERNQALIGLLILLAFLIAGAFTWILKRNQYKGRVRLAKEKARLKTEQTNAVILSQEEERKRFAMDLHDNFGQLISALRLIVSQNKDVREKSAELLDLMYVSLKEIAFNLMPQTLLHKGLIMALDELVTQLESVGRVRFKMNSFSEGLSLDQSAQIATYRIVQEIISNILKHTDAQAVTINLTAQETALSIIIEDDGLGFDPSILSYATGNGWRNIHSRLDMLEGEMDVDSKKERRGTTITLVIPYTIQTQKAA